MKDTILNKLHHRGGKRTRSGRKKSGYTSKSKSIPVEFESQINDFIIFLKDIDRAGVYEKSDKIQFFFDEKKKKVKVSSKSKSIKEGTQLKQDFQIAQGHGEIEKVAEGIITARPKLLNGWEPRPLPLLGWNHP